MLDVAVERLSFEYPKSDFLLHEIAVRFPKGTHTLLAGPAGGGKTTLLKLISGELRPSEGTIRIGTRPVERLRPAQRPLLFVQPGSGIPGRWSARHVLIAAAQQKKSDRVERLREIDLVVSKWDLTRFIDQRCSLLSSGERCRLQLAQIELLRPGILLANRLLEGLAASEVPPWTDLFYRTMRIFGTTLVSEPASREENRHSDRMIVLSQGSILQEGAPRVIHERPVEPLAALATGEINILPVTVRGHKVDSPIGSWELPVASFQGEGTAMVRPESFTLAAKGEDSDLILGVEEAGFERGFWHVRGFLTGGVLLEVVLPASIPIHKGKLLPLCIDLEGIRLIPGARHLPARRDLEPAIPPLSESR